MPEFESWSDDGLHSDYGAQVPTRANVCHVRRYALISSAIRLSGEKDYQSILFYRMPQTACGLEKIGNRVTNHKKKEEAGAIE
ncbi:MAG: hypothetical protein ACYCPP_07840 [Nitrososphaerales archaeon]